MSLFRMSDGVLLQVTKDLTHRCCRLTFLKTNLKLSERLHTVVIGVFYG